MIRQKVLSKIKKLEAMLSVTGPEAGNAKRLIEKLIAKYKLSPDELPSVKKTYYIKVHRLKKFAFSLGSYMKISIGSIAGKPGTVYASLNSDEYKMFYCLLDDIKHVFNKRERELNKLAETQAKKYGLQTIPQAIRKWKNDKLQSYMRGYMESNYPYDNNACRACGGQLIVSGNTLTCDECGKQYRYMASQARNLDQGEFNSGFANTTRKLSQSKKMITG